MAKKRNKVIGYLRVSTLDQDLEKNKADILKLANEKQIGKIDFVEEKISGRVRWKDRKIGELIEDLNSGDSIVVSELSRLGRSMLECMEILSIATQKGLKIFSVKGNWELNQSIQSKIIAMAFSMAGEIERDLISQRTKEALRAKKESGVKLGRPRGPGKSKLDVFRPEIEALLSSGSTQRFIAKRYGTTEANLHNWMRKHGVRRGSSS
jgi:DNA invertase Pin-like site-specific DNA recombinase